jgi:hypothetical protein
VRQLLEYIYGRELTEADQRLVDQLAQASLEEGLTIRQLVARIISSVSFRYRAQEVGQ